MAYSGEVQVNVALDDTSAKKAIAELGDWIENEKNIIIENLEMIVGPFDDILASITRLSPALGQTIANFDLFGTAVSGLGGIVSGAGDTPIHIQGLIRFQLCWGKK